MLGKCIDDDSCCERLGCYRGMCVPRLGGNVFVETQRVCGKMMDDCEGDRNCCDKLVCDFGKCMLKRRTFLSLFE